MNARKILCLMAAVLMLSGCSNGVDGSQASSKAAESSGKARVRRYTTPLTAQTPGPLPREKNTLPLSR